MRVPGSERELDAHLFQGPKSVARTLGWQSYHTFNSQRSKRGFPDRVCWRDRVIYVETKGPVTRLDGEQRNVLSALAKAGAEVYLVRPADVEAMDKVLAFRWEYVPDASSGVLRARGTPPWTPPCLWTPAGCRHDEATPA